MPRKAPPPGYYTATQAIQHLNISEGMLYKYVRAGKLHSYKPSTRKQGFYLASEVDALAEAERAFFEATNDETDTDGVFTMATPEDMESVSELAKRLLSSQITADRRREWMTREPRGHYVVRRKDGTVVAYFYLQPLKHDKLVAYMRKEIRGWDITAEDIEPFAPGKPVEVMLGGIGSLDEDPGYVSVLLRGIREDLKRLGQEGVTMSHLYAYSDRPKGIAMCVHLGMYQWEPPIGKRATFVLDVEKSNTFILQPY